MTVAYGATFVSRIRESVKLFRAERRKGSDFPPTGAPLDPRYLCLKKYTMFRYRAQYV